MIARLARASLFGSALWVIAGCTPDAPPAVPQPYVAPQTPIVPPPPATIADPPPVTTGNLTIAYENGLRIVVKRLPGSELAAAQLYIRGGARNWKQADAGIELLALRTAVSGGTERLDRDTFTKTMSALGSDMGASSSNDYSVIAAKSLTAQFDATFELLTEAFLTPALPDREIENNRQRQLTEIRRDEETPDGRLGLLVTQAVFAGHPYANRPVGTIASVNPLTRDGLKTYLAQLRETSRLELVVVGDVTPEHVRDLVRSAFGKLPRGSYVESVLPTPKFNQSKVSVTEAKMPTNYIQSTFIGPSWRDPDFATAIIAMSVLGDRVWEEVRTKRNLSYAPKAGFRSGATITRGMLYVTAVDPNTTMKVMFGEVTRLSNELIPDKDLAGVKAQYLTGHLTETESVDGEADWLGLTDIVGGDVSLADGLPERIKTVTTQDIETFIKSRATHLQTVVLGDPSKIDKSLFESL
jgi:zinc protease